MTLFCTKTKFTVPAATSERKNLNKNTKSRGTNKPLQTGKTFSSQRLLSLNWFQNGQKPNRKVKNWLPQNIKTHFTKRKSSFGPVLM